MRFFEKPYTIESIKKQYRELSKKLHPDNNGDASLFVEMQKEKDNLIEAINKHTPSTPPKKKKVLKKIKYKHIHIVVNGNDIVKQFFKQIKKWN